MHKAVNVWLHTGEQVVWVPAAFVLGYPGDGDVGSIVWLDWSSLLEDQCKSLFLSVSLCSSQGHVVQPLVGAQVWIRQMVEIDLHLIALSYYFYSFLNEDALYPNTPRSTHLPISHGNSGKTWSSHRCRSLSLVLAVLLALPRHLRRSLLETFRYSFEVHNVVTG